jgi:hypothetical protein
MRLSNGERSSSVTFLYKIVDSLI